MRSVKGDVAGALQTLRAAASPRPEDRVVPHSPQMVGLRLQASAPSAGTAARVPAHPAHVRQASELTRRGAPTTDVMLAGKEDISMAQVPLNPAWRPGGPPPRQVQVSASSRCRRRCLGQVGSACVVRRSGTAARAAGT